MRLGIHVSADGGTAVATDPTPTGQATVQEAVTVRWPGSARHPTEGHAPRIGALLAELLTRLPAAARAVDAIVLDLADLLRARLPGLLAPGPRVCALLQIRPQPPIVQPDRERLAGCVADTRCIGGGFDIFGNRLRPLDLVAVDRAITRWRRLGVSAVVVAGAGSVLRPDDEVQVAEHLVEHAPDLTVWLSHEIDGLGLSWRENATILQAVLHPVARELAADAARACRRLVPGVRLHAATDTGGRMTLERWRDRPLPGLGADCATLAAGAARFASEPNGHVAAGADGRVHVSRVRDWMLADPRPIRFSPECPHLMDRGRLGAWVRALPAASTLLLCGDVAWPGGQSEYRGPRTVRLPDAAIVRALAAALTDPVVSVERIVAARDAAEIERALARLSEQSFSLLVAQGATPGTERVLEAHASALPFVLAGAYRVRVRATAVAAPEPGPGQEADPAHPVPLPAPDMGDWLEVGA